MSGTHEGGLKARETNLAKDPDFYKRIGALGGAKSRGGGFASTERGPDGLTGQERARLVGSVGGRKSKRGKMVIKEQSPNHTEPNFEVDETESQWMLSTESRSIPIHKKGRLKRIAVRRKPWTSLRSLLLRVLLRSQR